MDQLLNISEQQLSEMRHATAWPECYRNVYATEPNDPVWCDLVDKGLARVGPKIPGGLVYFVVTDMGLELLLNLW